MNAVLETLGYKPSGGMYRAVGARIRQLGLDTSHFRGQGWAKGHRFGDRNVIPLDQILVRNSTYSSVSDLRKRLLRAGIKDARCEECGLDEWRGRPMPLQLDHINGDHIDHRLENLRILCANCHALTDTWCGRGRAGVAQRQRPVP